MKEFFKFMFASILGTFVSVFLLFFIVFVILAGAISSAFSDLDKSNQATKVEKNSILHMELAGPIVERGPDKTVNFNFGGFSSITPLGLDQILANIKKAKADDKIKGIYLDISILQAGMASVEEIRNALIDFKADGKWIVAYSEIYGQKAYYLASVADEIYVYPEGMVDFRGLGTNIAFLKGMFEKLEIEMQVIRGSNNKFKSAVEPFMLEEMSQANRLQTSTWMSALWSKMITGISLSRDISVDDLHEMANSYAIQTPQDAVDKGLVSAVKYGDEVRDILKAKVEAEKDKDLNLVSLNRYRRAPEPKSKKDDGEEFTFVPEYKKPKIAVIYASGSIASGESGDESIGSETFAKAIREARQDTSVKAIVFRINSPGGSALASDVIWRETILAKAEKPLIVSMGDVAASGGYYIAAGADKIYAQANTITGSIGVFGIIPNMKDFFNNKTGITFDGVKTEQFADFADVSRPLTDAEFRIIQKGVDQVYDRFTTIVSEGRNMRIERVDSIGQGRVWSGTDALAIGLVDEIGGINDAIAEAARRANIEDYVQRDYPKRKDPFQEFLESLTGEVSAQILSAQLGGDQDLIDQLKYVKEMKEMKGIQARMPYNFIVE